MAVLKTLFFENVFFKTAYPGPYSLMHKLAHLDHTQINQACPSSCFPTQTIHDWGHSKIRAKEA